MGFPVNLQYLKPIKALSTNRLFRQEAPAISFMIQQFSGM